MTLWIFGDSYAYDYSIDRCWYRLLAKSLNMPMQNAALFSSGLEYTYHAWEYRRKNFQSGDVAVICLTSTIRRWFFKQFPEISGPSNKLGAPIHDKKYNRVLNEDSIRAIDSYFMHLDNELCHEVNLLSFMDSIDYLGDKINLTVCVIPGFPGTESILAAHSDRWGKLLIAKGNLFTNVNLPEQNSTGLDDLWLGIHNRDPRRNHMCWSNHAILAHKINSSISGNLPLDLTNGFIGGILPRNTPMEDLFVHPEIKA